MGKDNKRKVLENSIEKKLSILIGKFAVHLYSTHGYPCEVFKNKIEQEHYTYGDLLKAILKHRDFKWHWDKLDENHKV